ncbi:MAG: DUF192 domain-containing protein [Chloroflexota bacterium]
MAESMLVARNLTRDLIVATRVEVAGGLWAKFLGLMGRPALDAGAGLWLPDSNGIHMMFMRFPIDVVFLGAPGASSDEPREVRPVLSIHRDVPPWRGLVPFIRGARGVLELPVGAIDAARVEVGDLIVLS